MNIVLQNYNDLLKKMILNIFTENLKEKLDKIKTDNVMNYINLLSNLDDSLCKIARESLVTMFETIDKTYINSHERKCKYDIKSHHNRTIMTIFGEITFRRTFYVSKSSNKSFCYLDRLLGLHKYDYFDPYLKAIIVEYATNRSYPEVAKYINDLIGNRIKINKPYKYMSRQTVRNIIMNAKLSIPHYKEAQTPETIQIIADEKWIHTQNNNKKDVMVKSIVLFEDIKKHRLHNKMIFASIDNSFKNDCLDYIYNTYDIDKIKTIYVMGDGAKWIKNLAHEFKLSHNIKVIYGLDKFHFKQSLRHIFPETAVVKALKSLVLKNNKEDFNRLVNEIIDLYPHREKIIKAKQDYIVNNWKYINNLYKYNLSCPMESQISHNIAALFSSRPKGYSIKTINKLIKLRLLFRNEFNIKKLYLNNFNNKEIITIKKEELNFNIFDRNQNINIYNQYLFTPDNYRYYR